MRPSHEDSTSEVASLGDAVDPGDGVFDLSRFTRNGKKLVEADELDSLVIDIAGDDWAELHFGPRDKAGETEPPIVARNHSGFSVAEHSRCAPSERTSSKRGIWHPKVPATWWFFPWTSLAIAPPTVTYLVPGVVGRNQPRGTAKSRMSARETPASQRNNPVCGSNASRRESPAEVKRVPPSSKQTSP